MGKDRLCRALCTANSILGTQKLTAVHPELNSVYPELAAVHPELNSEYLELNSGLSELYPPP